MTNFTGCSLGLKGVMYDKGLIGRISAAFSPHTYSGVQLHKQEIYCGGVYFFKSLIPPCLCKIDFHLFSQFLIICSFQGKIKLDDLVSAFMPFQQSDKCQSVCNKETVIYI